MFVGLWHCALAVIPTHLFDGRGALRDPNLDLPAKLTVMKEYRSPFGKPISGRELVRHANLV